MFRASCLLQDRIDAAIDTAIRERVRQNLPDRTEIRNAVLDEVAQRAAELRAMKEIMMSSEDTHPVQRKVVPSTARFGARVSKKVTLAAYEVYSSVYAPQEAIITGNCRGGFGTGELIAFLYARAFPRSEWRQRVDEAIDGMENL
jgi:hypothetical protein